MVLLQGLLSPFTRMNGSNKGVTLHDVPCAARGGALYELVFRCTQIAVIIHCFD